MFDIYHFSLTSTNTDLPGMRVTAAPRKADRRRQKDVLAAVLTLTGRHPLDQAGIDALLDRLVEAYFSSPGTVTAGIRQAVEKLNEHLMERNRNGAKEGWNTVGLLNLAILHDELIYVVNVGPTHTFFLGHAVVEDWGPNGGPRGLGLSNQLFLRFYSEELEPGDLLVFCANPPASWTEDALQGSPALTFDHLRRRLLNQAGPNLRAGVVQFKAGNGQIHTLRLRPVSRPVVVETPAPLETRQPTVPESAAPAVPQGPVVTTPPPTPAVSEPPRVELPSGLPSLEDLVLPGEQAAPEPTAPPEAEEPIGDLFPPSDDLVLPLISTPPAAQPAGPMPAAEPEPTPEPLPLPEVPVVRPVPQRPPRPQRPVPAANEAVQLPLPEVPTHEGLSDEPEVTPLQRRRGGNQRARRQVASVWLAGRNLRQKISKAFSRLLWRILPTREDQKPIFPSSWMWFVAIAVPLVVVAIAMTIYTQLGRDKAQQVYLLQAREAATQAMNEQDLVQRRTLWDQTLQLVVKAEEYGKNEETRTLRRQIETGLDDLDKIKRLVFSETLRGGLAESVNIVQLASYGSDVFALDATSGSVLRLVGAGGQFEVDAKFICRPGNYGGKIVTNLVDLIPLPKGIFPNATVLAVDETGNLMYCGEGLIPTIQTLTPPDGYLGKVSGIVQTGRVLLVLDKGRNMIWRYGDPLPDDPPLAPGELVNWSRAPKPYFQETTPALGKVVDMAVNEDALFLVDSDGVVTICDYSAVVYAPTSCQQPATFEDARPGHPAQVTGFDNVSFARLNIDPLTRQSLYALDVNTPAVYRFSLHLFLDKIIEADAVSSLPAQRPTAFVVTTNQYLILAYGNRLFITKP